MARASAVYGAYLFKDKDPAIDAFRTVIKDELGGTTTKHMQVVAQNGGPAVATLDNWFNGDTKKPQNASLEAAGRAIGYERIWKKMAKNDFDTLLKKSHKIVAAKKRLAAIKAEKAAKKAAKK